MRGEFIGVWSETWREIWEDLAAHDAAPNDLFCELYRELAAALKVPPSVEALADIIDNPIQSKEAFEKTRGEDFSGERALALFLENAQGILDDLGGDSLANQYFNLLAAFIDKFSLRYDLRRPCTLCPTLTGVFASLVRDLSNLGKINPNVDKRMKDFEEAVRDLRYGQTEGRIANCVAKQVMLLEAIGSTAPGVTGTELAGICKQLNTWPHVAIKNSLLGLYGFASDFPGFRHGTESKGMLRDIEMRDMIAVCILLAGFTPYLTDELNAEILYRGR
jgi:hypothetical protein